LGVNAALLFYILAARVAIYCFLGVLILSYITIGLAAMYLRIWALFIIGTLVIVVSLLLSFNLWFG